MRLPGMVGKLLAPEGASGGDAGSGTSAGAAPSPASSTSSAESSPSGSSSTPSGAAASAPESSQSPGSGTTSSPSTSPTPDPGDTHDVFAGFGGDYAEQPQPQPQPTPAPPPQPPAQPAEPQPQPAPPAPPVAAQSPEAVAPAAAPPAQQSQLPPPGPGEPARIAEVMRQSENDLITAVAAQEFKLAPEVAEAFGPELAPHVERLMATVWVRTTANMLNHLAQSVPAMISQHMAVTRAHTESMGEFYTQFPQLREHEKDVLQTIKVYRGLNPQASRSDAMKAVGTMVMALKGITHQAPSTSQPQPAVPAAQRTNGRSQPFVPAIGSPSGPPAATTQRGEWDGMGDSF